LLDVVSRKWRPKIAGGDKTNIGRGGFDESLPRQETEKGKHSNRGRSLIWGGKSGSITGKNRGMISQGVGTSYFEYLVVKGSAQRKQMSIHREIRDKA